MLYAMEQEGGYFRRCFFPQEGLFFQRGGGVVDITITLGGSRVRACVHCKSVCASLSRSSGGLSGRAEGPTGKHS